MTTERVAFLLAVLVAGCLVALVHRHWHSIATRLGGARRMIIPALTLVSLGAFAKIASEVHEREMSELDRRVSLAVHRFDAPVLDIVMRALTALGSFPAIVAVLLLVSVWSVRRHDKAAAILIVTVAGVAEVLNLLLKEIFQRARPSLFTEIATLHSYSFPSGHAMSSTAVYGGVALLAAKAFPAHRRLFGVVATVLVLLIGLSRIYLGVHWFTDVVAGFAAGLFVLLVGVSLRDQAR